MMIYLPPQESVPTRARDAGFALLIAVIFMSVMLAFALTLGALGYKQSVLAGAALESQYAFYAADAALECAQYNDTKGSTDPAQNPFVIGSTIACGGSSYTTVVTPLQLNGKTYTKAVVDDIKLDTDTHCAKITVYKPPVGELGTTWLFSEGYNVKCGQKGTAGARFAVRGLQAQY